MSSWVDKVLTDKGEAQSLQSNLAVYLRQDYSTSVDIASQEVKLMVLVKERLLVLTPLAPTSVPSSAFTSSTTFTSKNPSPVLSEEAFKFIKEQEGFKAYRYADVSGNGTYNIGLGHQILPNEHFIEPISEAQAKTLFMKDWVRFYNHVIETIKIPLKGPSIIALASLAYSTGHIPRSISKLINENKPLEATIKWKEYIKAEDSRKILRVIPALVSRRQRETALFLQGFQ